MATATFSFANGATARPAYGQKESVIFTGTWAAGDQWYIRFLTTAGNFVIGAAEDTAGNKVLAGTSPSFGLALSGRVFLANGARLVFSDNNDPEEWYEQGAGAGFVQLLRNYGGQDSVLSLASYQGMLAAFLRNSIQIWVANADPSQFQLKQVLSNVGTAYAFSVQSLGDYDVLFLADSGIRSLRVRDQSLNAFPVDIGSPIDGTIQGVLAAGSEGTPVSVVEPLTRRYWLFLKDTIYVLSYFAQDRIFAWSTYKPTMAGTIEAGDTNYNEAGFVSYTGLMVGARYTWTPGVHEYAFVCGSTALGATASFVATATTATVEKTGESDPFTTFTGSLVLATTFTPVRFVVKSGTVYCRGTMTSTDYLISYSRTAYDTTVATLQTPFFSLQSPSTRKFAQGIDLAITGAWTGYISLDQASQTFESLGAISGATYDGGLVGVGASGTHAAVKLVTTGATSAVLSSISLVFRHGSLD